MASHIKWIDLNLCGVLLAMSAAHATDSERMLKDSASKAISEFRMTGDVSAVSHAIDKLTGQPSAALLSVCPDILNALYEAADPAFDVDRAPLINISPGGPYPSGTDPESIKDPQLKAEYQKRLANNREYAEYFRQQSWIFHAIDQVAHVLRQSFGEAAADEVRRLLVHNGMQASYGDDFLKRMERQVP